MRAEYNIWPQNNQYKKGLARYAPILLDKIMNYRRINQ
jgi:hypothetical protein